MNCTLHIPLVIIVLMLCCGDGVKRPPCKNTTPTKRPPIQKDHLAKRPPIPNGNVYEKEVPG